MVIQMWDGGRSEPPPVARLREFVGIVASSGAALDAPRLAELLDSSIAAELPGLMRLELEPWRPVLEELGDAELVALVRFFALAEHAIEGCEAGKRSPAIAAARVLRARQAYPAELTAWLRKHSTNRFLPYGSLLDTIRAAEKGQ